MDKFQIYQTPQRKQFYRLIFININIIVSCDNIIGSGALYIKKNKNRKYKRNKECYWCNVLPSQITNEMHRRTE